jgi:hypothetical protein
MDPAIWRGGPRGQWGQPRPRHLIEVRIATNRGQPPSPEHRREIREARRRRGTRPPDGARLWTPEENALRRALPPAEGARRTGPTLTACYKRRGKLGLPEGRPADGRRRAQAIG